MMRPWDYVNGHIHTHEREKEKEDRERQTETEEQQMMGERKIKTKISENGHCFSSLCSYHINHKNHPLFPQIDTLLTSRRSSRRLLMFMLPIIPKGIASSQSKNVSCSWWNKSRPTDFRTTPPLTRWSFISSSFEDMANSLWRKWFLCISASANDFIQKFQYVLKSIGNVKKNVRKYDSWWKERAVTNVSL